MMNEETRLLRSDEAARKLGILEHTLRTWRMRGIGPRYVRLSARAIRYDARDLDEWIAARQRGGDHAAS